MNKSLLATVMISVLIVGPGLSRASATQDNKVMMAPGFEKGQQSQKALTFAMPKGWTKDDDATRTLGVHSVLVPNGKKLENADRVITIAFQKKDPGKSGPEEIKNFGRGVLNNILAEFPEADLAKWQPSKLDPSRQDFWSIELYGKEKSKPVPQRLLILDAGDGYYSVSLTVEKRKDLELPLYEDFFNSISLGI